MNITIERAREYFKTRTAGVAWDEYSTRQKEAAIAQARRDLARLIGRPIKDDEPEYREGDKIREEYAVYEQAVYSLLRDAAPMGATQSAIPSLNQEEAQSKTYTLRTGTGKYSAEALSWLAKRVLSEVVIV